MEAMSTSVSECIYLLQCAICINSLCVAKTEATEVRDLSQARRPGWETLEGLVAHDSELAVAVAVASG